MARQGENVGGVVRIRNRVRRLPEPRAAAVEMVAGGSVPIAIIDGPCDYHALSEILALTPIGLGAGSCGINPNAACNHGTFIVGLLGARRDAPVPGLCPECRLLHIPLFVDEKIPWATVDGLADAIRSAVIAGARLINLSLAILGGDPQHHPELASALDQAEASDAVVVAAVGNQGRLAMGQLLSHPVTIPVAAVDFAGRLLPDSNFGPSISRRGVAALGHNILGYAPGGGTTLMSGTSVATAVATGALAVFWSGVPEATGSDIRSAVSRLAPRDGSTPPMLNPRALRAVFHGRSLTSFPPAPVVESYTENYASLQGEATMRAGTLPPTSLKWDGGAHVVSENAVTPAQGPSGCDCGAPDGTCTCANGQSSSRPIYVLGSVDIVIPHQAVSEELQTVASALSRDYPTEQLQEPGSNEELRSWQCRVLSKKESRYLARQMCWILKIEGHPAYYLSLRDLHDLDDLIRCLGRSEKEDLDLFVGSSNLIDVDTHPGISLPVLSVDQIDSFRKEELTAWFKTDANAPPKLAKRAPAGPDQYRIYEQNLEKLFKQLGQNADNRGDTDELRALNYLAVRYRPLYERYAEIMMVRKDWTFDGVRVIKSRLSRGEKRLVDPIFTFRHKPTGDVEQYFLRVDVSHLFPMVVHHIDEYFER